MVEQGGPQELLSLAVLRRNPMPTTGEFLAWLGCRRDVIDFIRSSCHVESHAQESQEARKAV